MHEEVVDGGCPISGLGPQHLLIDQSAEDPSTPNPASIYVGNAVHRVMEPTCSERSRAAVHLRERPACDRAGSTTPPPPRSIRSAAMHPGPGWRGRQPCPTRGYQGEAFKY